jgi:hypothetical protein
VIHALAPLLLFIYTIAALGLAYVVGHAVISRPARLWIAGPQFAECPVCRDTAPARFEGATCEGPSGRDDDPPTVTRTQHPPAVMRLATPGGPRFWIVTLLECPVCFGFWTGLVAGTILGLTVRPIPILLAAALPPIGALYTAGSNFILARLTGLMPDPLAPD